MNLTYIIVIILLVIIILLYNNKENFLVGNEAVGNIASLYADVSGVARFNNLRTNYIKTNNLDVNENINILQDKLKLNNVDISGNLQVSNNVDISGNLKIGGTIQNSAIRYIRLGNKIKTNIDSESYWTIHEVEAYDASGTNIALNKPVTVLSGKTYYQNDNNWSIPGNITNGKAIASDTDCYHGDSGKEHELEIDLGKEYDIKQIVVYNRYSGGSSNRANNTTIQLLDANKNVSRIIYTGNWYQAYSKEYLL